MATDYFTMMRDVVGSYGEGLDLARSRARFDAEEARKATKFNQEQEQYERTRGIQRDTDAAFGTYKALQDGVYDGTKADFSGLPQGIDAGPVRDVAPVTGLGGGAVPKRAATRLENIGARRNIAAATRDFGSLGKLEEESRSAEWDDSFAKHYKSYTASPEQVAEAAKHINTNSKSITLHDPDKQGFRQMSVVTPDGTATLLKLGKHDQAQLWAASQLMDLDPQKALALMHGIDKNLAAAVAAENDIVDKVGQHQNTMAYQRGLLANNTARLDMDRANANRPSYGQPIQMVGKDGQPALMQPIRGKDGSVKYEQVHLPEGFRFPKQVDPARVEARANALVGTDMPGLVNGKKVKYDTNTAYEAAQRQLYGDTGGAGVEMPAVKPPPRVPVTPAPTVSALPLGDRQLADRAKASGYEGSIGRDGKLWFSRVINGQGENLTPRQVADRLGLVYD